MRPPQHVLEAKTTIVSWKVTSWPAMCSTDPVSIRSPPWYLCIFIWPCQVMSMAPIDVAACDESIDRQHTSIEAHSSPHDPQSSGSSEESVSQPRLQYIAGSLHHQRRFRCRCCSEQRWRPHMRREQHVLEAETTMVSWKVT